MESEKEVEKVAQKHLEAFMNDCELKDIDEAKLASQKVVPMAYNLMKAVHEGKRETVQ